MTSPFDENKKEWKSQPDIVQLVKEVDDWMKQFDEYFFP